MNNELDGSIKKQEIEGRNPFPDPLKAKCFRCEKEFWIKFVIPQQNYSQKNSWEYWTKEEKDQGKHICNFCLKDFYLNEKDNFLVTIRDLKRRKNLRSYIARNVI